MLCWKNRELGVLLRYAHGIISDIIDISFDSREGLYFAITLPAFADKLQSTLAEMHVFPDFARFCKKLLFSIEQSRHRHNQINERS